MPERAGPSGTGRPRAAVAALRRHDPRYDATDAARARRTAGRGRGHGRLVAVGARLLGQREPFGAQVQVGHAAGDDLMEGRKEAHCFRFVRPRITPFCNNAIVPR